MRISICWIIVIYLSIVFHLGWRGVAPQMWREVLSIGLEGCLLFGMYNQLGKMELEVLGEK